jgi:hypothetical protein
MTSGTSRFGASKAMALTLISHFWNEEFLLPYWLRHHYSLFDEAVLIDYGSSDRSLEIIGKLAPRWQVRPSRNEFFDACEVDKEVMEIEREFTGWKIVLNTTEFLLCHDLRFFLRWMEMYRSEVLGVWPFDLTMVDALTERNNEISPVPLFLQKHWGYHSGGNRSRLLHRFSEGSYVTGRHTSTLVPKVLDEDLFILWFGWCPIRYVKERKLQIQKRIPPRDQAQGLGRHHLMTPEELEAAYRREANKAYDLFERHPAYRELIKAMAKKCSTIAGPNGAHHKQDAV